MYLSLGYLDGATNFAQSCGDTSLPWGHKEGEDDRRFAYRCMMQAHKVLKSSRPQRSTIKARLCQKVKWEPDNNFLSDSRTFTKFY